MMVWRLNVAGSMWGCHNTSYLPSEDSISDFDILLHRRYLDVIEYDIVRHGLWQETTMHAIHVRDVTSTRHDG